MTAIRTPAVSGSFYPSNPDELRATIRDYLAAAEPSSTLPKALIVPHAGYLFSGPVAASAYARLAAARDTIRRVVLLGPSHFCTFSGLATSSAEGFATPLGTVPVDREAAARVLAFPQVAILDEVHAREHSLEVHLPFLQETLDEFSVLPLLVGKTTADEVAEPLEAVWGGAETVVVVSSDLSHFHDYQTAKKLDRHTSECIETQRPQDIGPDQACGCRAIGGLLAVAHRRGLSVQTIDLRNSGDTAGPRDRVVGYGAYVIE